jgi:outer membrane protein OmpA-like peptidoglycan-associated protein
MIKKLIGASAISLLALPLALPAGAAGPGGFYVGIGGGISYMDHSKVDGSIGGTSFSIDDLKSRRGWAADAYVGYSWGFPRVEAELVYRNNKLKSMGAATDGGRVQSGALMINMLVDILPHSVISPYVGIGLGGAYVHASRPVSDSDFVPAAQGIVGASYKLTPNWAVSIDYRYFRTLDPHMNSGGTKYKFDYENHTGMIGVTYHFSEPPRPAPAAPPPPPPPQVTRNYMVFFDFDKSAITSQAMATIREAASNALKGGVQRIKLTGHTDRAGTEQYNMALSLRRASAVKDALVREGVPSGEIVVIGRGESQPLVPTADGVREAQNRRVEIVLN